MHEPDVHDRNSRFEMIAACDDATLVGHAEAILDGDTPVEIRQVPTPQLVMQRVREPVEAQSFNLGEVLVTAAEVAIDGCNGFAMVPGKAETKAISGAIVDAAVEANHSHSSEIADDLEAAAAARNERREREWAESRATTVQFKTMEDEL